MVMATALTDDGTHGNFEGGLLANRDPFQILIICMLSTRTTERCCRAAAEGVFSRYKTPVELAKANVAVVENLVRPAGMPGEKAVRIIAAAKYIIDVHGGTVPQTEKELQMIKGVGPKVSAAVLSLAFGQHAVVADTHVHKIANRLGWVKTKSAEQTQMALMNLFDKSDWDVLNPIMVRFGREFCTAPHPHCLRCPLNDNCAKVAVDEQLP
jgi:endonuclease-3